MFHNMLENVLGGGLEAARPFNVQLRAYSVPFYSGYDQEKVNELNHGGKVLLPPSCLDWLVRLHIQYPMMFRLTNPDPERQRSTHVGVLEFLAEEGKCYCPGWIMQQLSLGEGDVVQIEYRSLPVASFAKFKPMSVDFLDIACPRVVLEVKLRSFGCLTKGDKFPIHYNDRVYEVLVKEVRPANAVSIIECDMNVEFDAPEGYVDPSNKKQDTEESTPASTIAPTIMSERPSSSFVPFQGEGQRLDGKAKTTRQQAKQPLLPVATVNGETPKIVTPNNDYVPGNITFIRDYIRRDRLLEMEKERELEQAGARRTHGRTGPQHTDASAAHRSTTKAFSGAGRSLRDRK